MKKLLIILLCLLCAVNANAATYGVANESCETVGTQLTTGGGWEATLEAAAQGTTYLLRAGTYTPSGGIVVPTVGTSEANRITIKAYCDKGVNEAVTISGKIQTGSYLTVAGMTINCSIQTPGCVAVRPPTIDGTAWAEGTIVRNNRINVSGSTSNMSGIRVHGDVRNVRFTGNDIVHAGTGTTSSAFYGRNNVGTGARDFEGIYFANNKVQRTSSTGGGDCFQYGNAGPTSPGDWRGTTHIVENNWFLNCSDESVFALKPAGAANAKISFLKNYVDGSNSNTDCILIENQTPANTEVLIEENIFYRCDAHSAIEAGNLGGTAEVDNWIIKIRRNIFDHATATPWALHNQMNNVVFERNTVINGLIGNGGGNHIPTSLTFIDNTLTGTAIANTQTTGLTCTDNNFHNLTGDTFDGLCSATLAIAPSFVNYAGKDYNQQAAGLVDTGTSGPVFNGTLRDVGWGESPVIQSCKVEDAAPSVIVATYSNNIRPPLSNADNTKFSATVATVARTINTSVIASTNLINHTLASAVTVGQVVTLTGTYGGVQDTSGTGGPEINLNAKARAFSALTCANTVGGAPTHVFNEPFYRTYRVPLLSGVLVPLTTDISQNARVNAGSSIVVAAQVTATVAAAPSVGVKWQYNLNAGGWVDVPDTFGVGNVKFAGIEAFGGTAYPQQGFAMSTLLDATGLTTVEGSLQRTSAAVPTFQLNQNAGITLAAMFTFDTDVVAGTDEYQFRVVNQDGTALAGTVVPAVVNIIGFGATTL